MPAVTYLTLGSTIVDSGQVCTACVKLTSEVGAPVLHSSVLVTATGSSESTLEWLCFSHSLSTCGPHAPVLFFLNHICQKKNVESVLVRLCSGFEWEPRSLYWQEGDKLQQSGEQSGQMTGRRNERVACCRLFGASKGREKKRGFELPVLVGGTGALVSVDNVYSSIRGNLSQRQTRCLVLSTATTYSRMFTYSVNTYACHKYQQVLICSVIVL